MGVRESQYARQGPAMPAPEMRMRRGWGESDILEGCGGVGGGGRVCERCGRLSLVVVRLSSAWSGRGPTPRRNLSIQVKLQRAGQLETVISRTTDVRVESTLTVG